MGLFDKEKKMIDDILEQAVDDVADAAVDLIAKNAPIWSGEYVSSITVETGDSPESYPRSSSPFVSGPIDPAMRGSLRQAAVTRAKAQIAAAASTKRIHIGNSAPHAHIVESQHAIYKGTEAAIQMIADAIVKMAEKKVTR